MQEENVYRVCFVCSGNICRSPMGEIVLRELAERAGVGDRVIVDSAGTGDWHIGERADRRTLAALAARGYNGSAHRARQFDPRWFGERDLIIALDRGHERTLRAWAANPVERERIRLLRSFDSAAAAAEVRDPYYDGQDAFDEVLDQIEAACHSLLDHVLAQQRATARAARS